MENRLTEPCLGLHLPGNMNIMAGEAFRYIRLLNKRIRILSYYIAWGSGKKRLDVSIAYELLKNGLIPMITWEPWQWPQEMEGGKRPEDQPNFSLAMILIGKYDDYIRSWARDFKQISGPVFLRLMHEMNGNWYPWSGSVNGNRPEEYVEVWRYIRSIFNETDNDRVMWVWSPYAHSVPDESGNEIWRYYPGPSEVDWLALDGYNWGKTQQWSTWQSFEEVFRKGYDCLSELSSDKPIMLAEVGCAEEGGDKGKWIEESFGMMRNTFSRIKALVWFNINKECDWRVESSLKAIKSFRKGLKNWLS